MLLLRAELSGREQEEKHVRASREQEEKHVREIDMLRVKAELSGREQEEKHVRASREQEEKHVREIDMLRVKAKLSEKPLKRRKLVDTGIQLFVQSAAESYKKWKRDYRLALSKVGEDPKEMRRPFLELKGDPLSNFHSGFLLWVRECYTDMRDILSAAEPGRRFTILGTSGIGKSVFTFFWICYRATLKEKVVWKSGEELYLLDFRAEPLVKQYDPPSLAHPDIREVLNDENAWLVINGGRAHNLVGQCKILQACSMKKDNYKEYSKNLQVELRYFPVWEEGEVCQFLDEFEEHRLEYKAMGVPVKDAALRYFRKIGGVARYVLSGSSSERRWNDVKSAVDELSAETCLDCFAGRFEAVEKSDALIHIKCPQREDKKYSGYTCDFASFDVRRQFAERFEHVSKVTVVQFLKLFANSTEASHGYGYVFELVAHDLFKRGGEFRMKRVMRGGDPKGEEVAPLKVPKPVKVVFLKSLKKLRRLNADTYYQPRAANFKSIDAILHPDYLLQYFSYNRGFHGYLVQGLVDVGEQLHLPKYKVCSCVPIDKYDETGFQPWLSTGKTRYKAGLPQMIKHSEQYVIAVDYNNYRI